MALQTLPLELIESIADKIDSGADLSAFSRTSRHLNKILDPRLYAFYTRRGSDKALFFSIAEGYCSVLNKTIQSGADLNSLHEWLPGARFTTPLAFAAGTGHVEIVKLLLKHGANPNPARWREIQQTPLSVAAGRGNYEIAKILIEAGADVYTTVGVESGSLALYAAACCSDQDDNLVQLLLDKGVLDVSPQEYKGTCALESAIQCGNPSTVKLLVQAGANPVFKTFDGLTPAMLAMEVGSEDLAFLFLETGADLEQTCDRGQGLVWYAVMHSCTNVLRYLLERGCSANYDALLQISVTGVRAGREMTGLLLDAGASVEQQDEQGKTPLRLAFQYKDKGVMELLMERGASLKGAGLDESQHRSLVGRPWLNPSDISL
ncbi:hypothetical protein BHE90_005979 [Fusarium euwallaceae]|uniref:Uncharacterized protein n=1 Tax=Fusarium euwallaceae TaxID=1147111 RepID=A0A430LUX5_9HYPO|nr:hypothetical protein BHE90_005979 [Fusarium euwallaceae]